MKNYFNILFVLMFVGAFLSCEMNEIDTAKLTDFAPGIASMYPADGGKVVQGNFDIVMAFAEGNSSPLASADLTLLDSADAEVYTTSATLSGTADTLRVSGSEFGAASLGVGAYTIHLSVTDTRGQVTEVTTTFEISKLPYAANNDEMYIAGALNGWTWDSLILVADYTWELKNVEMDGGEFKFKNTKDWTDQDWGDSDCDGVMEVTTGGGPNTNCGYSGLVNITFNDNTLAYTITPAVTLEGNLEALYLLGSFNNFQGEEYAFTQTEDHVWVLDEVVLKPGDSFKFSEGPYSGRSFGDVEPDSIADEAAPNIVFPAEAQEGVYSITFNDETFEYSFTFIRNLFPSQLFLVGDATTAGWDPEAALEFTQVAEGQFEIVADLLAAGGFKFLQERGWNGDWGMGAAPGTLEQETESNITVEADGAYKITVDFTANTYTVASAVPNELFLVGGSTVAGWTPADAVPFTELDEGVFRLYSYLTVEGEGFKFLEVRDWAGDWGVGTSEGTLEQDTESNVTVPADGFYRIDVNFNDGTYSVTESNWGVVGDATGSWEVDTDMSLTSEEKGVYTWSVDMTLTEGEIKFRENDAWNVDYGDNGADGSLEQGGSNIAVSAGTYTITMSLDPVAGYTYSIE